MVDGADTTDDDRGAGARSAGVLGDLDTGGHALEHVVHPVLGLDLQVIGRDRGNGGRHHGFLLDTVTDDHRLFQHLGILGEEDFHDAVRGGRCGLGHIADAGDLQDGVRRDAEGEGSVRTGHGTVGGSLLDDKGADNRLARIVEDDTADGDVLRPCCQAQS